MFRHANGTMKVKENNWQFLCVKAQIVSRLLSLHLLLRLLHTNQAEMLIIINYSPDTVQEVS